MNFARRVFTLHSPKPLHWILLGMLLIVFAAVVVGRGWACDDAYITFRTVDNLTHGYRLTWNVNERVQAYTHPLWMFLLSGVYAFTREIYRSSIFLSVVVSLGAAGLLAWRSRNFWGAVIGLLGLAFSGAFVDYSTSGLENPLSHLLLGGFLLVYGGGVFTPRRLFWLSLLASLAAVNRMDLLLVYAPALLLAWFTCPQKGKALGWVVLGQAPFLLWEAFSLVYYGFLFPNTAYAKLNTAIPDAELWAQGLNYFRFSLEHDPLTLVLILTGIAAGLAVRDWKKAALSVGMILYLGYILKIGGDFMAGRFFSALLFMAAWILASLDYDRLPVYLRAGLCGAVLLGGVLSPFPTYRQALPEGVPLSNHGVTDERAWYWRDAGLWLPDGSMRLEPTPLGRSGGLEARAQGEKDFYVLPVNHIGVYGFYAGPRVHIIDRFALSDPLLARLPSSREVNWYVGHFRRVVPEGYITSIYTGTNAIEDHGLAAFYDKLNLIVRGSLFSNQRWQAIWEMNTGQLDGWIDFERYRYPDLQVMSLTALQVGALPFEINDSGLEIDLGGTAHGSRLTLELSGGDSFEVVYRRAGKDLTSQEVGPVRGSGLGMVTLETPEAALRDGFERVRILPLRGSRPFQLGKIELGD